MRKLLLIVGFMVFMSTLPGCFFDGHGGDHHDHDDFHHDDGHP